MGNEAQLHDSTNESADKEQVDERDEEGVSFGAVVGKEGCDGPGGAEDGDDEENKDVVWCECVVRGVDMYEPGEHAECWDL